MCSALVPSQYFTKRSGPLFGNCLLGALHIPSVRMQVMSPLGVISLDGADLLAFLGLSLKVSSSTLPSGSCSPSLDSLQISCPVGQSLSPHLFTSVS